MAAFNTKASLKTGSQPCTCVTDGRRGCRYSLTLHSALVGARDAHIFPVLRDRAASNLDALRLKDAGDLLVGQRSGGVFFLNELLDPALQDEQRGAAAFRAIYALGKE